MVHVCIFSDVDKLNTSFTVFSSIKGFRFNSEVDRGGGVRLEEGERNPSIRRPSYLDGSMDSWA